MYIWENKNTFKLTKSKYWCNKDIQFSKLASTNILWLKENKNESSLTLKVVYAPECHWQMNATDKWMQFTYFFDPITF